MKMCKKAMSMVLALAMVVSLTVPALAQSANGESGMITKEIVADNGSRVVVNVPAEYRDFMTDARIQEFGSIPDLQEGDVINIENIGGVSPISDAALDENITPWNKVPIYRHVTTKTKDKGEYIKKDEFIISVAKGKQQRSNRHSHSVYLLWFLEVITIRQSLALKMLYRLQYKKLIFIQGLRTAKAVIAKNIG